MTQLTPRQEIEKQILAFEKLVNDFCNNMDENGNNIVPIRWENDEYLETSLSQVYCYNQTQGQERLLQKYTEIFVKIEEAKKLGGSITADEEVKIKSLLQKEIKFFPTSLYCHKDQNNPNNVKFMLEVLIPKNVIFEKLDNFLIPVERKLKELQKKAVKNHEKYDNVAFVANEIIEAVKKSKNDLRESNSVQDGLKEMERNMVSVFTQNNNDVLRKHRGDSRINSLINNLNRLSGYILYVLTYPARFWDEKKIKKYINSWFEERETSSYKIFSTLQKKMDVLPSMTVTHGFFKSETTIKPETSNDPRSDVKNIK